MKVPARVKKSTELFQAGGPSRFVAGPLKTLREINGSVVAARHPNRPPRLPISNLHGFPETLGFLRKMRALACAARLFGYGRKSLENHREMKVSARTARLGVPILGGTP